MMPQYHYDLGAHYSFDGGNLFVELDIEDYKKGMEELKYSVVVKNYLQKGIFASTTMSKM